MTSMVDVTFLLLIFFMVTTAFAMQRSLSVPIPSPEGDPHVSLQVCLPGIVVEIDEFNTYHVTTHDGEHEAPSEHDLIRVLRSARSSKPLLDYMLVKANPESLHEKVFAALDGGAYVGIPQIELMTLKDD